MEIFIMWFFVFLASFIFGTIMGSFLNVLAPALEPVVFREKAKTSFWQRINRRSQCLSCNNKLSALELVPILSFLFLKRKCLHCKKKFSFKYLLIEILTGLIFVGLLYFLLEKYYWIISSFFIIEFLFWIPVLSALVIIFLFDLKYKIIPDIVLLFLLPFGIFYSIFDFNNLNIEFFSIFNSFIQSILFASPFFFLWFFSQGKAMGFADWKFVFVLSFFMEDHLQNLIFVFLAFWIGAIVAIPLLILRKKYKLNSEVPFGPFLILSFLIIIFFNFSFFSFLNLFNY